MWWLQNNYFANQVAVYPKAVQTRPGAGWELGWGRGTGWRLQSPSCPLSIVSLAWDPHPPSEPNPAPACAASFLPRSFWPRGHSTFQPRGTRGSASLHPGRRSLWP